MTDHPPPPMDGGLLMGSEGLGGSPTWLLCGEREFDCYEHIHKLQLEQKEEPILSVCRWQWAVTTSLIACFGLIIHPCVD